jgi:hypothetical protein
MSRVIVKDVSELNLDDTFRVCSNELLNDVLHAQGIQLKRLWMKKMLATTGPCVKIAYIEGRPVAQLLFYSEVSVPYLPHPRVGVVLLRCVYNPFKEAQGKGASTALIRDLIEECECGPRCLNGEECRFIASEAVNTDEDVPLDRLYEANGFKKMKGEMVHIIAGDYTPLREIRYKRAKRDEEKGIIVFNPICEYSYPTALRIRDLIGSIYPALPVYLVNQWEEPHESIRLANHNLTVNGLQITSSFHQRAQLVGEIRKAVEG